MFMIHIGSLFIPDFLCLYICVCVFLDACTHMHGFVFVYEHGMHAHEKDFCKVKMFEKTCFWLHNGSHDEEYLFNFMWVLYV